MKMRFLLPMVALMAYANICPCAAQTCKSATAAKANESEVVVKNIMARRNIRRYTDKAINRDTLDKIIECGLNAPNGMNAQSYEIKVVNDPASTAFLSENLRGLYKAPVYMFIAAKDNYDMSRIDVGLLAENICLSAWAYGIGSINLGQPIRALRDKPEILNKLGFSEHHELCLVLALGYADEAPAAKPRKKDRVEFITIK